MVRKRRGLILAGLIGLIIVGILWMGAFLSREESFCSRCNKVEYGITQEDAHEIVGIPPTMQVIDRDPSSGAELPGHAWSHEEGFLIIWYDNQGKVVKKDFRPRGIKGLIKSLLGL
jgi:hypothetical protein